jgi:two-component system sensor histidine kinase PilS (NtrC family)
MTPPERNHAERRQGDRRQAPRREEDVRAWPWEATGARPSPAEPSVLASSQPAGEGPTTLTAALGGSEADPDEAGLISREARRVAQPAGAALIRIVRTYVAARAAVGLALVGAQVVTGGLGVQVTPNVLTLCVLYAVQAAALWLVPSWRNWTEQARSPHLRRRQWLLTVGVDLLAFGLLHALDAGTSFNYAALLVLPVLMSGILNARLVALGTAAGVALLLLGVTLHNVAGSSDGPVILAQSGLAGMGLFVIALMAGEMAGRMVREELAARGSLEIARQQVQLNRLVLQEMADGVMVVDRRLRVRAANPAARRLLVPSGMAPPAPFSLAAQPGLATLAQAIGQAMETREWPDAGREVVLNWEAGPRRSLRVRLRFTRGQAPIGESGALERLCVALLEDARAAQARVRQERLAAMGRVSAGIAHEFRNPLAAIAQANALWMEETLPPAQARLGQMVADNVRRLQRIVDDVLELAPSGADALPVGLELVAATRRIVADWAQLAAVPVAEVAAHPVGTGGAEPAQSAETSATPLAEAMVWMDLPASEVPVVFDPEHLRRVLVNLLDNALRHGTREPGAMVLRVAVRDAHAAVVALSSDGPPIAAEVEARLFEPFFSTRSRGSGLGLYICRELCERYGASIEFRAKPPHERHRNGFVIGLRRVEPLTHESLAAAAPASPLGEPS